jgi:hypothetical protein
LIKKTGSKHGAVKRQDSKVKQEAGKRDAGKSSNVKRKKQIIDIWDGYPVWLFFANAGMVDRGNLYCIDYAIKNLPDNSPIIEIGSFAGLSTNLISYYKYINKKNNTLIACDKWEFEGAIPGNRIADSPITYDDYKDFVKETFLRNVRMFSRFDMPYAIEKSSDEFFDSWRKGERIVDVFGKTTQLGGPVSFCYIDGDHSYEYAKRDFLNCDDFIVPGGFILFDDSADGSGWEVCKVVEEIKASDRYDLIAQNPHYFFQKK